MTGIETRLEALAQSPVIVVVRASKVNGLCEIVDALSDLGLTHHEITMTTPGALACIEELRARCPQVVVGAGTVLTCESARDALAAGAEFIVSPTLDAEVIDLAHEGGALAIPGSLTPTEAYRAWRSGADLVKIFPASIGGPEYLRALRGPLPDLRFVPTGGINVDNAVAYLDAGAFAVCLGTSFLDPASLESGDFDVTRRQAERLVEDLKSRSNREKGRDCNAE